MDLEVVTGLMVTVRLAEPPAMVVVPRWMPFTVAACDQVVRNNKVANHIAGRVKPRPVEILLNACINHETRRDSFRRIDL